MACGYDYSDNNDSSNENGGLNSRQVRNSVFKSSKRKVRKNSEQYHILEQEYEVTTKWDKDKQDELAIRLNLSPYQVYKWNWDRRRRTNKLSAWLICAIVVFNFI